MYIEDPNPTGHQAVLMLHGLGASSLMWRYQLEFLSRLGYRPLAPDLPGFGRSVGVGADLSGRRTIEALKQALNQLGVSQVDVVGLSMGGVLAQKLAVQQPQLVRRLLLASTFARLVPANFQQRWYFLRRFFTVFFLSPSAQAGLVANTVFPKPEFQQIRQMYVSQVEKANPVSYRAALLMLATHRLGNGLHDFGKPAWVIAGAEDTTVVIEQQRDLASHIHGARMVVVPNAGHGLSVECPDVFNQHLLSWLEPSLLESEMPDCLN